ncbi:MAG: membrane protein insertion efficiency factor YidD [Acidobacteria bacterium]|nr:membrane protein insertion efficiency factor YidD [Acidobacteriota bacterium]
MSPLSRSIIWCIERYQDAVKDRPTPCRYVPTCSCYAVEAVEQHGAVRGSWYATKRLGRCHPWSRRNGLDPVPERVTN